MILTDLSSPTSLDGFICARWSAESTSEWIEQAPRHRHHECREGWYVLSGSLGFEVDGQEVEVKAGQLIIIDPGEVHTFWNSSDVTTEYLILMTPKTAALIDAIHAMEERSWPKLVALFEEYGAELV